MLAFHLLYAISHDAVRSAMYAIFGCMSLDLDVIDNSHVTGWNAGIWRSRCDYGSAQFDNQLILGLFVPWSC